MTKLTADVSLGREELSSPLIRISPNGALLFIDGLNRLSGNYARISGSGMRDWTFGDDSHLALSGHADGKRAPAAPDLDWGMLSAELMWRRPAFGLIFGAGPTVQRMWVAGQRFRDTSGIQIDVVKALDQGHWVLLSEIARNRHHGENSDLDGTVTLLTLQRRLEGPLPLVDGLGLEAGALRERNRRGLADLSNRSVFVRATADRKLWGIDWSIGLMLQGSRFDAATFDELPARRDRYRALDIAAAIDLGAHDFIKIEANAGNNRANVALYDSRYRNLTISFGRNW